MNGQTVIICNMKTPEFWDMMLCFWARSFRLFDRF